MISRGGAALVDKRGCHDLEPAPTRRMAQVVAARLDAVGVFGYSDEEGTEAAAATGVVVGVRSMAPSRDETLVIKADRPFAWAIVDRETGEVLFAGTVIDPRG